MIKLKDLLVETQTFNFDRKKGRIMQLIKKVKNGESVFNHDNPFYEIIRNSGEGAGIYKTMGFKDDAPQQWKKYFTNPFFDSSARVWSQREFNPEKQVKQDGKTYNFYITVDRSDKDNVGRFVNSLMKLDNSLKQFSDQKGVAIKYKTHTLLDAFLVDNDSLKVYYYDPSLKSEIENIVKKWANDNNVKLASRSHEHGVDKDGTSYGIILADNVFKVFVDLIKNNPNHTDEEYYQWLVKHFVDIIRNIKVK